MFAKTDLVHAQQEGYTLEEICDGLCYGLARNIVDTLFAGEHPFGPIICAGGVSRNRAVIRHIGSVIGEELLVHEQSHLFGALGAALNLLEERRPSSEVNLVSIDDLLIDERRTKKLFPPPSGTAPFRLSGVRRDGELHLSIRRREILSWGRSRSLWGAEAAAPVPRCFWGSISAPPAQRLF